MLLCWGFPFLPPVPQDEGRASVRKAIEYYKKTLAITTELKDTSGEGRAVGNLGNAYTAIGEYAEAIKYHERRLEIAVAAEDIVRTSPLPRQHAHPLSICGHARARPSPVTSHGLWRGPCFPVKIVLHFPAILALFLCSPGLSLVQSARARACGNLGNAYSALGDFSQAVKYYLQSLAVAKEAKNLAGQGQAYYCLGSTYTMLKNYQKAVEYHERHLAVATEVKDKTGQCRLCTDVTHVPLAAASGHGSSLPPSSACDGATVRAYYNLYKGYQVLRDTQRAQYYREMVDKNQVKPHCRRPWPNIVILRSSQCVQRRSLVHTNWLAATIRSPEAQAHRANRRTGRWRKPSCRKEEGEEQQESRRGGGVFF